MSSTDIPLNRRKSYVDKIPFLNTGVNMISILLKYTLHAWYESHENLQKVGLDIIKFHLNIKQ